MKFTLNWNITTYEATATGGCEVPTIITLYRDRDRDRDMNPMVLVLCESEQN